MAESDEEGAGGASFPQTGVMAKIQYLQGTHDARAGDIRDVAQPCAEVLVRLGKAEYITARRPAGQKKKRDAEHGECGTFLRRTRKNQKSGRDVKSGLDQPVSGGG